MSDADAYVLSLERAIAQIRALCDAAESLDRSWLSAVEVRTALGDPNE